MRIALRTSGGRGEYELAGSQGSVDVSDLLGIQQFYELTPGLVIPGRAVATRAQGKPRIRLIDQQKKTVHFYRLLAGVLLLPKPIRELHATTGNPLLAHEAYSMRAIKVDVADVDKKNGRVVLRPTDILIGNATNEEASLGFAQRMSRILRIWRTVQSRADPLSTLLTQHHDAVFAQKPDHKHIELTAHEVISLVGTSADPLPLIESRLFGASLGVLGEDEYAAWAGESVWDGFGIDDELSPTEAKHQRVKQWRQVAVRGAEGIAFRKAVSKNYDFRCVFSGTRMPKMDTTESCGVDAAHILPWASHNINSPNNGICLSKQCHWAFDEGVLKLDWNSGCNCYVLSIPKEIQVSAKTSHFDLGFFQSLTGPISSANLPSDKAIWPSPRLLSEFNRFMFS